MKNPDESWEHYVYRMQSPHGQYAKLYGFEPFEELFQKEIIVPHITAIRLMYIGPIDLVYMVNGEGKLVNITQYDSTDPNAEAFDPREVLSRHHSWWEVEGIKPQGFNERRCHECTE